MIIRARILLKADEGWSAPQVAEALDMAEGTVFRIKRRFAEEGLEGVLKDRSQAHRYRKLDDRGEAHLIALACSEPPEGHEHWTLRLLAGKVVELGLATSLSHETVRLHLKKRPQAPVLQRGRLWQKREWCIPQVSAEFVAHMEDVLDLYAEPYDPRRPVVCFDETPPSCWPTPGPRCQPSRGDQRGRTTSTAGRAPATCFWPVSPWLAGWRQVAVTERRTMQDFAQQTRWLVDEAYPEVPVVRVVLDNPVSSTGQALNTHRMASLYETFPEPEARQIAKRLEFHYTHKHGSWLNMAEIEFSVLSRCCLKQRVPDEPTLRREVQALVTERNVARATIDWRFNTQDARIKLHRLYPFDS